MTLDCKDSITKHFFEAFFGDGQFKQSLFFAKLDLQLRRYGVSKLCWLGDVTNRRD